MLHKDSLRIVRLLLLHGADPLDFDKREGSALDRAKKSRNRNITERYPLIREMQVFVDNPALYRSNCSALIAISIGLASLDLPVLIVTLISEYSVSINEEKLFAEYSEQKSWDIAALIKKKSKEY